MAPHLPIIDAHHHFHNDPTLDAWDSDAYPDLSEFGFSRVHNLGGRGFRTGFAQLWLEDDMWAETKGNNVQATVYMEAGFNYDRNKSAELAPVGETVFCREAFEKSVRQQKETKLCKGIVSHADLKLGEKVTDVLRAHEAAGGSLFKGIRHSLCGDSFVWGSFDITSSPSDIQRFRPFREAVSILGRMGLTYDCWLNHTNIRQLTEIARACPGTTVVCNHVGYPLGIGPYAEKTRRQEMFELWKQDITELASYSNVVCKVGGMMQACCMMGDPVPWASLERETPPSSKEIADTLAPWYLHAIQAFTPRRCMFESNWPMDRVSGSYTNCWNAFKLVAKDLALADQAALFHDTAARVYSLERSAL